MENNKDLSTFWGDDEKEDEKDDRRRGTGNYSGKPKKPFWLYIVVIAIVLLLFSQQFQSLLFKTRTVSYTQFLSYVDNGGVATVDINDNTVIEFTLTNGQVGTTRIPYIDSKLIDRLVQKNVNVTGSAKQANIFEIIINIVPFLLFLYIFVILFRQSKQMSGGGLMGNFGQSHAREYKPNSKDSVTFDDIAGQKEAKEELEEIVEFLKNPKKFSNIGAKIPKGVLLVGPPGTGKTLLARAVAGESKVSFLHTSGSDFVEMFVGMGAARVRDLFSEARKKSPCIVFIDELDAVGRSRGAGIGGGHDEREQTLNQMLVEMDGFDNRKGIIVMAATNRPDVLDSALLRPGRFDRQVSVELPDIKEREAILRIHFKKIKTESELDYVKIARATPGTSGADLANLANEAALLAARFNKPFVTMAEVELARDKILLGTARRSRVMSAEAKTATAYHEAGHALLHYYVKGVDPLHKVTIIPHGMALGLTMSLPEEDVLSRNETALRGYIKITMGGYVAEEIVYGETTTGTSNDIKQATNYAHRMVTEFGMSKLGFVNYSDDDQPIFLGREISQHKNYSEETARIIDAEIRKILDESLEDVRNILKTHKRELDLIAQNLVEKETLDDNEIRELLGMDRVDKKSDLS